MELNYLDVMRGRFANIAMVAINGHNDIHSATRTTISPNVTAADEIDQSTIAATPGPVKVASTDAADTSAGTGLRTALLTGLDTAGDPISEIITLTGTTEVQSVEDYSAVLSVRGLTWGSGGQNAGTIWVGNGTFTAGKPATKFLSMEPVANQTLTGYYVVPAGKTFFPVQYTLTLSESTKAASVYLEYSLNGGVNWFTPYTLGIASGPAAQGRIIAASGFPAGTHIRLRGAVETGVAKLTAVIAGALISNENV